MLNAGLYGAACRASPRTLGVLEARRGETPLRFSPHPFCGVGEKYKRSYCFFTFARPAFIGRRRVAATASLAALMLGGTRLSASLAPCALGGDRLATTVCGQTPLAVVLKRYAYDRMQTNLSHRTLASADESPLAPVAGKMDRGLQINSARGIL